MIISSETIYAALRARYCAPEYALFFEVANGTGSNIRRYADAAAMGLFPSRGLTLSGFEVKVSRQDWQRELQNPHKAEEGIFKYCDHWWIVAPNGVVAKAELPPTWGLLEMNETGVLRQSVAAPNLDAAPLTRSFIAALLRRASEADQKIVDTLVRKKTEEWEAKFHERVEERAAQKTQDLKEQIGRIERIEQQIGFKLADVDFSHYASGEEIGRAIKLIIASGLVATHDRLQSFARDARAAADKIERHFTEAGAIAPLVERELASITKRRRASS